MYQRPNHTWLPLLLLLFIIPFIFAFLYFGLVQSAFRSLGLTPTGALLFLVASLVGGMINIPLNRRRVVIEDPRNRQISPLMRWFMPYVHYYPPMVREQVIAVNVGGALIPIIFSIYLLLQPTTHVAAALIAMLLVAIIAKLLARPVPGVGITMPAFLVPIIAAGLAFILLGSTHGAAPVAYIAGALGTLIGADLLNLPQVLRGGLLAAGPRYMWPFLPSRAAPDQAPNKPQMLSIGGAGVFDGIFLTAVVAAFLV
jgi:uncharacterized membrane protein